MLQYKKFVLFYSFEALYGTVKRIRHKIIDKTFEVFTEDCVYVSAYPKAEYFEESKKIAKVKEIIKKI